MLNAEQIVAAAPFTGTLGIVFAKIEPSEVRAELNWSRELSTIGGGLHGGALMSLADIAATVCAVLNTPSQKATTVDSTSYFLRPVKGVARAVARPLRVGQRLIVVEVDVLDDEGRLCGRTTQQQMVLEVTAGGA